MAGLDVRATTPEVALTAATVRTVLQFVAPANHRVRLRKWRVSFDGTTTTAEPVVCRLLRQTTAGTMSAQTLTKSDNSLPETIQSSAQHSATAEPTAGDLLDTVEVHPQSLYEGNFPLGFGEVMIGGGGRIGIECKIGIAHV